MKIVSKQVKISKILNCNELEKNLNQYGEPLRWAIVKSLEQEYLIEAVFIEK